MTAADIIIVIVIAMLLIAIIAANIIKKKKGGSPCSHCPSRKDCVSRTCVNTDQKSGLSNAQLNENRDIVDESAEKLKCEKDCKCDGNCSSCAHCNDKLKNNNEQNS